MTMLAVVEHAIAIAPSLQITYSIAADRLTITSAIGGKHQVNTAATTTTITESLHVTSAGAGDYHQRHQRHQRGSSPSLASFAHMSAAMTTTMSLQVISAAMKTTITSASGGKHQVAWP